MKEFIEKLIERLEEHCGIANEICCCDGCCSECDFRASIGIVKELEEEYQSRVMIDKQYCWQTCVCTDKCMECNRLTEGDFDYYESIADWDDEYSNKSTNTSIWIPCSERLPEVETTVLIHAKRKYKDGSFKDIITTAMHEDGTVLENDSCWRWEDIEGEWDEENDCYIIPEGWWEDKKYNADGELNHLVDDEVIEWQPLPSAPYRKGE